MARSVVQDALNYMCSKEDSISKWQKAKRIDLSWREKNGTSRSASITFDTVVARAMDCGELDWEHFGVPRMASREIAGVFGVSWPQGPARDHAGHIKMQTNLNFGPKMPVQPVIDREGAIFTSLEPQIIADIASGHATLVESSDRALELEGGWLRGFRQMVSDSVSIVDMVLHELYVRAKYAPKPSWRFDQAKLGARYNRRLAEKLKWVGAITGKHLDNISTERAALTRIKTVRNHLNHFDPPCFAYTVEDLAVWMNDVSEIGSLLWKVRRCMGEPITQELSRLVLLRTVEFVPRNPAAERFPQEPGLGYVSSTWGDADEL